MKHLDTSILLSAQTKALEASRDKVGFGFLLEMGLGKTLIGLMEAIDLHLRERCSGMVVLCPPSFRGGWWDEIVKWDLGDFVDVLIWESGADWWHDKWIQKRKPGKLPIVVVNYEAIRSANYRDWLKRAMGNFGMVYADESPQIKTHDSLQTKGAIELSKHARYARIASGKWITEGPHDVWSQMRFIKQLDGQNYFAFRYRYCKMGGFKGKSIIGFKEGVEDQFGKMIAPHVFQATKDEYIDLPPKVYTQREYKLNDTLQKHYDMMMNEFLIYMSEEEVVAVDVAVSKYIKLAQIQAGFILDEDGKFRLLCRPEQNGRLQSLLSLMRNDLTTKICIPYFHRGIRGFLENELTRYTPVTIAGGMTQDEIRAAKDQFNGDPKTRVILLQTRASKYGHTLVGGEGINHCSTMAFFESTFSLDDRSQIEDRIHRIGQKGESCLYIDFVGTPMDKKFITAIQRKEDLFQALRLAVQHAIAERKSRARA